MTSFNKLTVDNISLPKPISMTQAVKYARREVFLSQFHAEQYQIIKRISNAPQSLRNGGPPPVVGR